MPDNTKVEHFRLTPTSFHANEYTFLLNLWGWRIFYIFF